jgi:hypothetical protein
VCRRHNAVHGKARTAPCSCSEACDWFTPPKDVDPPTEAEAARAAAVLSGKAIVIGGEACDALQRLVDRAMGEGRVQFASRLRVMQQAIRKAAIEDVDRELEEKKQRLDELLERAQSSGEVLFRLELPIYTKNEGNARQHHMAKQRELGDIRPTVEMAVRAHASVKRFVPPFPCVVRLTRLCPPTNRLDKGDNVSSALKRVRDGVADWMRINDRSRLVEWVCNEETAQAFGVRIEIIAAGGMKP